MYVWFHVKETECTYTVTSLRFGVTTVATETHT
jgi:hypothetical protein